MSKASKSADASQPGQAPKEAAPKIEYALLENGDITRTDKDGSVRIACYVEADKRLELVGEHQRYRPSVVRFLNENEVAIESVIIEGDTPDEAKSDIPPCPKPTMRDGDKTPAVVDWYKRYKPAEYKARYGIIGPGTVTKTRVELDEKGQKVKVPYTVDATIAHRKVHTTEKIEANNAQVSGYADA